METKNNAISAICIGLISFAFLIPWIYVQSQTSINSNSAWLTLCAQRLLEGGLLSTDCYDTNPPLSILAYTPFVLLGDILSVEIFHMLFWLSFIGIIFSVLATYKLSGLLQVFTHNERLVLAISSLCALTIWHNYYVSEREHFIGMMLLPFILTQINITAKNHIPYLLKFSVLILGTIVFLIKPHYGLIPAFILLHRMITQRRLWVIKDADFLVLSIGSIAYILIVLSFFQDFITVILPDVLWFYLPYNNPHIVFKQTQVYSFFVVLLIYSTFLIRNQDKQKKLSLLSFCTLLGVTIYTLQMKGFYYHILSTFSIFIPITSLTLYILLFERFKRLNTSPYSTIITILVISFVFGLSYIRRTPNMDFPTHHDYQNNTITQYIDQHCDEPCSYLITYNNMDIVNQIAFYSKHTNATRFPSFWFQPSFEGYSQAPEEHHGETLDEAKIRYANYIAEDLTRFSPSLLLLLKHPEEDDENKPKIHKLNMNFFDYYKEYKSIQSIAKSYEKIDTFTIDIRQFYKGTSHDKKSLITWDVYKKNQGSIDED
ncbi:MAG: hypothetical protein ACRBDL_09615 [Alphaproteobacteria bacterium]